MFDLGIQELIVIFIVALIVFGPKRLPELGKTLGKGMLELRKAMEGIREQMHAESEALSKPLEGSAEEGEKKNGTGVEPAATPPPPESPYTAQEEKAKTDAGTVSDTTNKTLPEARKEDKVDDR
ncbi:MAG: twin-arginine translocase TatA/TatE family subunit [Nitrospirae bacterium]|nr:twin-arginine translocase TatA/TatE family subunit [Nitrospirota bacterium]MCL5422279.1 twin-arginine translocase TatA/TatE family subunit [Nitrospirota bacterium]